MRKKIVCLTALILACGLSACNSAKSDYKSSSSAAESVDESTPAASALPPTAESLCDRTVNQAMAIDQNISEQVSAPDGVTEENISQLLSAIEQGAQAFQKAYECTSDVEYAKAVETYEQAYAHFQNVSNTPTLNSPSIDSVQSPSQAQSEEYSEDFISNLPVLCQPAAEAGAPLEVVTECVDEHFELIDSLMEDTFN